MKHAAHHHFNSLSFMNEINIWQIALSGETTIQLIFNFSAHISNFRPNSKKVVIVQIQLQINLVRLTPYIPSLEFSEFYE